MANTTFNSGDKAASVTLSNSDLTATAASTGSVRVVQGFSTGKYYFEFSVIVLSAGGTGLANLSAPLVTSTWSNAVTIAADGTVYMNNSPVISMGGAGSGTLVGIAADLDNKRVWFRNGASGNWNNNATYNPATNTGGVDVTTIMSTGLYPYAFLYAPGGAQVTGNFGDSAFTGAVPSGFTSGWPAPPPPPADVYVTQVAAEMWATTTGGGLQVLVTQASIEMWATTASLAAAGRTKVWNGSAWVVKPVKVWNGSAWV